MAAEMPPRQDADQPPLISPLLFEECKLFYLKQWREKW